VLSGWLLCLVRAEALPKPNDLSENEVPAYASSAAFNLQPKVNRASFHLRRLDLQSLYKTIGEAYGIRFLYDSDLGPPRLVNDFQIEDATLKQALEAAATISKTFVAPLDEHTAIVASDNSQKRSAYERQVLGTFQVDEQASTQQMTEISSSLRTLLDLTRVSQDTRSNWISVVGRTRQVAAAREFLQTLEKERGEVLVDVDILEIDSQRARQLGILPPQPFQLLYIGASGALPAAPIAALSKLGTLYGVSLPGSSAALTFTSSAVRSRQKLQLRAGDGQQANLLFGSRYPVLNGLISASFFAQTSSTTAVPTPYPSVQYQDLGISMKATPYLHAGRELTLQMDLSIRDLGGQSLNGAPVITNRQVTEQVRLRDGETYLIGGILSHSEQESRSGYPWLSRLPLIGALFGSRNKQQAQTEFLMLIRPHVVRPSPAEEVASEAIFFGREIQGLAPAAQPLPAAAPPQIQPGQAPFAPGTTPQPPQPGVLPQPGVPGVTPPGQEQPAPQGQPQAVPPQGGPFSQPIPLPQVQQQPQEPRQ